MIKRLKFDFIPLPYEVLSATPPLLLVEWHVLAYLCKQIRFGEALQPITDAAICEGTGLSRNAIKKARLELEKREWLTAENISDDLTRPKWQYRLLFTTDEVGVTERHLVSQRDTALSQRDTALSQRDTCNKEYRKSIKKTHIEKAGDVTPPPKASESVLIIARKDFWNFLQETQPQVGRRESDAELFERVKYCGHRAGFSLAQLKEFLAETSEFKTWPLLEYIDTQERLPIDNSEQLNLSEVS